MAYDEGVNDGGGSVPGPHGLLQLKPVLVVHQNGVLPVQGPVEQLAQSNVVVVSQEPLQEGRFLFKVRVVLVLRVLPPSARVLVRGKQSVY